MGFKVGGEYARTVKKFATIDSKEWTSSNQAREGGEKLGCVK